MSQQLFYIVMTGMNAVQDHMTATTNNLANVNTTGFKAHKPVFQSVPFYGQGQPTRADVATREETSNFVEGPIEKTGRDLDVAVKGPGWIGVRAADGAVAYTRNGALSISPTGLLQTNDGHPVLGRGGLPISLPSLQSITIGADGTVSGVPMGQSPDQIVALNRIMLVNPPPSSLQRRTDGLFQDTTGTVRPDGNVALQAGALEGSNADSIGMMMNLIENTRSFQTQTEFLRGMGNLGQGQSSPLTLP